MEGTFPETVAEVLELKMGIAQEYSEALIKGMGKPPHPEEMAGKPYEQWTREDLNQLGQFYGPEPNTLSDFIFEKEFKRLKAMEQEE